MSEFTATPPDLPPSEEVRGPLARRWPSRWPLTLLAWAVILGIVGVSVVGSILEKERPSAVGADAPTRRLSPQTQMQAKFLVGLSRLQQSLGGKQSGKKDEDKQLEELNVGSPLQRMAYIVLSGDLLGPDAALHRLAELRAAHPLVDAEGQRLLGGLVGGLEVVAEVVPRLDDADRRLLDALETLYRHREAMDYRPEVLSQAQRDQIRSELGWVGELALAPAPPDSPVERAEVDLGPAGSAEAEAKGPMPDAAAREDVLQPTLAVVIVFSVVGFLALGLGLLGLCGLGVLAVYMTSPYWRPRVPTRAGNGGVYVETFALWMLAYIALSLSALLLHGQPYLYGVLGLVLLFSLVTLGWPVLRGIPWRQVRRDIGLNTGAAWWKEACAGVAGYAMALPCLGAGALLMFLLIWLQRQGVLPTSKEPTHPILEPLTEQNWAVRLQVLFLAAVVAPVLEEIAFRGLLYTHLRAATRRLGLPLSMPISGLIGGFVFAAIHPQGWVAIPALGSLAFGFSLMREWRGSLVPSMVAHGIHNGTLILLTIFLAG